MIIVERTVPTYYEQYRTNNPPDCSITPNIQLMYVGYDFT